MRFATTLFLPHPLSPSAPISTDLAALLVSGVSVLSDSCETVGLVGLEQCGGRVVWGFLFVFCFVDVAFGLALVRFLCQQGGELSVVNLQMW